MGFGDRCHRLELGAVEQPSRRVVWVVEDDHPRLRGDGGFERGGLDPPAGGLERDLDHHSAGAPDQRGVGVVGGVMTMTSSPSPISARIAAAIASVAPLVTSTSSGAQGRPWWRW